MTVASSPRSLRSAGAADRSLGVGGDSKCPSESLRRMEKGQEADSERWSGAVSQRWVSGRLAGRSTLGSPLSRRQSHLIAGIRAELSPCRGPCGLVHKAFWMEPGGKAGLDSISCLAGTLMWPVAHSADSHTPSGRVQVGDTEFLRPQGPRLHGLVQTALSTKQTRPYSERRGRQGDGRQTKSDLTEVLLDCHQWRGSG